MELRPLGITRLIPLESARIGLVSLLVLFLSGCGAPPGSESEAPGDTASVSSPHAQPKDISGRYHVKGTTTTLDGENARQIEGSVVLEQQGNHYTVSFDLDTTYPGRDDVLEADVIGSGEGTIQADTIKGTTAQQLIVAAVPGVDTGFAFIPRSVGTRIVSSTSGEIGSDGSMTIQIETRPEEGETYIPTRTKLTGIRLAKATTNVDE